MNRPNTYSNFRATMAIAKASFRSILRSPSAVVFTLAFPLIFIIVFANLGGGGPTVDVGITKGMDTTNAIYQGLKGSGLVHLINDQSAEEMSNNLSKGSIDAIIDIQSNNAPNNSGQGFTIYPPLSASGKKPVTLNIQYTKASPTKGSVLRSILNNILYNVNKKVFGGEPSLYADVKETTITGREYKYIDFILPGMLGFSLMGSGVFGTAFVFLSLRLTLVIKRFFATPVKKYSIVLGEALARLTFALLGALILILIGHFVFGFTLIHGVTTVVNMLVLSALGLIIFMGFGFTISGIAKNESTVPPLSNIITLPQFLLSGTFFSTTAFPAWLQIISKILPLTYLNDAMRKVAFEGAGIADVSHQLLILGIWFIVIYAIAVKTFKWE